MNTISNRAKERFCRDTNIPIRVFEEPYFTERIELFDFYFHCLDKYKAFCKSIEIDNLGNEELYFQKYNQTKENIMDYIRNAPAFERFQNETKDSFSFVSPNIRSTDIYKQNFDGKTFVSIDMKKANFSSLRHYDKSIVKNTNSYEEFVSTFTDCQHFIDSKYIRQVVFGNLNPKRQIAYEKYLMFQILTALLKGGISEDNFVFFSNDELIVKDGSKDSLKEIIDSSKDLLKSQIIPDINLRYTKFTLKKILGIDGYLKYCTDGSIEIKGVNQLDMPFLLRTLKNEDFKESDYIFSYEGSRLAKLLTAPNIVL